MQDVSRETIILAGAAGDSVRILFHVKHSRRVVFGRCRGVCLFHVEQFADDRIFDATGERERARCFT